MSPISFPTKTVLAQVPADQVLERVMFDLPQEPWEWLLFVGGVAAVLCTAVFIYARDTRSLGVWSKSWLWTLRLGVLAALFVIALNPQERTQSSSFRPSRVALVVDTSHSMRYPAAGDSEGSETQSRSAAAAALLSKTGLIERLRERHEVSIYTFDETLHGALHVFAPKNKSTQVAELPAKTDEPQTEQTATLDWNEMLQPRGLETRLGESLLELTRQVQGRTLSGIVVISDGASNAGIEPSTAHDFAKMSKVRLVTVGVGSTQRAVNLQVANIQAPTDVHVGDAYEISAFIQAQGLQGRRVGVELLMKPEDDDDVDPIVVANEQATIQEDGVPVEVKFTQTPSVSGSVEFFVRARLIAPLELKELSQDDNERRKAVNISERKTRVLLIAGGPMRDYRFVRNMLSRHPAISVDVWLQSVQPEFAGMVSQESDRLLVDFPGTAAELFEYDVVTAFDPDWKQIAPDRLELLRDWVADHAGGLILVAGDIHTPELASASGELQSVQELYPVYLNSFLFDLQLDASGDQAWPFEMTREGHDAGFLNLTEDAATSAVRWNDFGGVYRCYPTSGAKAGATVYAHFSDPRAQTEYGPPILLASQFYGAGRTLYMGSAEMWRLRAIEEEYYDRFWIKTIREVGQGRLKRGTSRGMLLLERDQYLVGQTVRVRAQLLDPQLAPLDVESVVFDVFDPAGKPIVPRRRLFHDENRPGQFVGDFRASQPGTYRVEVPIPESREQLATKIDVLLPNLESDNPRQNAKLLSDLARDTGGRYLRLDEAEQKLAALLPNRSEEFLVDERLRTLWDREWVLLLLVGLLSAEWLTRKTLKLA
jgi:hypothetical protein